MTSKEYLTGVFSRNAVAYRQRLEDAMKKGQAAGRDALLDYVRARPGMRLLDLCCGPGTLTIPLARDLNGVGEVIRLDLTNEMLEIARKAAGGRSLPVRFLHMDVEQLQFPAASFDAAACGHGLQFLANLGRGLREVRRVLKPKGRFAASIPPSDGPEPNPAVVAFRASFDKRLGLAKPQPELAATRAVLDDLDRFRAAVLAAGFRFAEAEVVEAETSWESAEHFAETNASWWAFAARLEGLSDHVQGLVVKEAARAVRAVTGDGPFTTPARAHVVRAEA
ncbi:MAG: methyltransferase domain-containing protein [Candidatus Dormibacteraeota bacterium]|nr:methyltransferase domain-containing protein [Candidatus Dormibacteraeota bacterium]